MKLAFILVSSVLWMTSSVVRGDGIFSLGPCPVRKSPLTAKITDDNYVGTWFEYSRYSSFLEATKSCVSVKLDKNTLVTATKTFTAVVKEYSPIIDQYLSITGSVQYFDAAPFELLIGVFPAIGNGKRNYYILSPDAAAATPKFLVIYTCQNVLLGNVQRAWTLTDVRAPSDATISAIANSVAAAGLNIELFRLTSQTNCPLSTR